VCIELETESDNFRWNTTAVLSHTALLSVGHLHFTASEISADDITAPISPHRTSPPAKLWQAELTFIHN